MRLYRAKRLDARTGRRVEYGAWRAVFRDASGRLYRRSTGVRDVTLAAIKAADIARHVERVKAGLETEQESSRLTFREAVPLYLGYAKVRKKASTLAGDVKRLRILCAAPWAGLPLSRVTPADLTRWATARTQEGTSGATVNRDLALASALWKWAVTIGHASVNPVKRVERFKESGGREVYLTAEESRALLDLVAPALRPILVCALSTGMRRGELLALEWRDVDRARREIHVRPENEKTGRGRVVPMTEDLAAELSALRASLKVLTLDGTGRVFTLNGAAPLSETELRRMFGSAVARCTTVPLDKRERLRFHDVRHTAASLMVAAGVPLFDVAKILGHSTLAVTMRYAHFAPEAGRAAIDKLGGKLAIGDEAGQTRATGTAGVVSPVVSSVVPSGANPGEGVVSREARATVIGERAVAQNTNASAPLRTAANESERRERDSNPRGTFAPSGFQDRRHRPLGHPSLG